MCSCGDRKKSMWSQKHVGFFLTIQVALIKRFYLPLQTLSGFGFPSWIKIAKSSMINFPILSFPSLSGFSWPLTFLPGCKTRAAGLDRSLWTQTGLKPAKTLPKILKWHWGCDFFWYSGQKLWVRTQEAAEVPLVTPPHHSSFLKALEAEANPSRSVQPGCSWGLDAQHALGMGENIPNIFSHPWPSNILWISDNPQPHISHLKLKQGTGQRWLKTVTSVVTPKCPFTLWPSMSQHKWWSPHQGLPHGAFLCAQGGLESKQG